MKRMKQMKYGKFKGERYDDICDNEWSYIVWLCKQPTALMTRYFDLIKFAMDFDQEAFESIVQELRS